MVGHHTCYHWSDAPDPLGLHLGKEKDPLDYRQVRMAKNAGKFIGMGGDVFWGWAPDW